MSTPELTVMYRRLKTFYNMTDIAEHFWCAKLCDFSFSCFDSLFSSDCRWKPKWSMLSTIFCKRFPIDWCDTTKPMSVQAIWSAWPIIWRRFSTISSVNWRTDHQHCSHKSKVRMTQRTGHQLTTYFIINSAFVFGRKYNVSYCIVSL